MSIQIGKSGTGINKSGTGINKSGTGIHRSGTGIKKGGTGRRVPSFLLGLAFCAATFTGQAVAADPDILLSERNDNLMISLHTDEGIFTGATPSAAGTSGYYQVALQQVAAATDEGMVFRTLVKGSGSGDASEGAEQPVASTQVKGSGSGSSGESAGVVGGSLLVKGSGSGNSGESACDGAHTLVKGSGSGSSGEAAGQIGGSLLVKGSGSGSSGNSAGCALPANLWGVAEVVVDRNGAHVIVHRFRGSAAEEFLVAFLPGSGSEVAHSLHGGSSNQDFVAAP